LNRPFKECYGAALRLDPKVAGKVTIATQIAGDGSVRRVTANGATLPEPFVHCLQEAVLASKFGGPGGNGSTVMIPVSFELSK
jgi:hypothetical protein